MLAILKRFVRNLRQGKVTMAAIPPVCNFGEKAHDFTLPATELPSLRAQHRIALATPRQVTRLLCGLSSPALSKAKLTRHALFGTLEIIPFARVLAAVESNA